MACILDKIGHYVLRLCVCAFVVEPDDFHVSIEIVIGSVNAKWLLAVRGEGAVAVCFGDEASSDCPPGRSLCNAPTEDGDL